MVASLGAEANPKKLIEAAVAAVEEGAPPPIELRIAWDCHRWNTNPGSGGLMDQDYGLIYRMDVTENIYNSMSHLRSLKGDQIHTLSDGERDLIQWLREIKVLNG
jgi:hypothetical protein